MKRFDLRYFPFRICEYCNRRVWFWQESTAIIIAHISCCDRDFWTRHKDANDLKEFHYRYFGKAPWDSLGDGRTKG